MSPDNNSGIETPSVHDPQPWHSTQSGASEKPDEPNEARFATPSGESSRTEPNESSQASSRGAWTAPGTTSAPIPPTQTGFFDRLRASGWFRSQNHIAGGVSGGLAQRWAIDPIIIRGVFIVLLLFFGVGALLYGLLWMLLPESGTGEILVEQVKLGNPKPILALPIIIAIIGLIRIPAEFSIFLEIAGLRSLLPSPGRNLVELYTDGSAFEDLANIPAIALYIFAVAWVGYLIYRHEYVKAGAWFLGIGVIGLVAGLTEMLVYGVTDIAWKFPVFTKFLGNIFLGFPLAAVVLLIVWIVTLSKAPAKTTPIYPYQMGSYSSAPATAPDTSPDSSSVSAASYPSETQENYPAVPAYLTSTDRYPFDGAQPLPGSMPVEPPIAGPSRAFNLAIGGLVVLAIVAGMTAQFGGLHAMSAYLLTLGLVTVILGGAMLFLALKRRRTSWLTWVTPLLVLFLTLPATGLAVVIPKITDFSPRFWQEMLDNEYYDLKPGSSLDAAGGEVNIDLRDEMNLSEPITVNNFHGRTQVFLHPDQPVRFELSLFNVDLKLSSMSDWSGDEIASSNGSGILKYGKIDSDRPQYFNAAGEKVTFTDSTLNTGFGDGGNVMKKGKKSVASVVIENTAARKASLKETEVIELNQFGGEVNIFERPREEVWNGAVLPDGHYLVAYWLDDRSNTQVPSSSALPATIASKMVESGSVLGGKIVDEYVTNGASLSEIKEGRLGPWEDNNNNGYNDHYEPGGDKWTQDDTVSFEPKTRIIDGTTPSDQPSTTNNPSGQDETKPGNAGEPSQHPEGSADFKNQTPKNPLEPSPKDSPTDIPQWLNSFPQDSLSEIPEDLRQRIQEFRREMQNRAS